VLKTRNKPYTTTLAPIEMRNILFIIILILPTLLFGQSKADIQSWEIGCETMTTQTEMNICSYESYKLADGVLTELYTELTKHLDSTLTVERKNIESLTDTLQIEYFDLIERQLKSVKKSQEDFYKFLNSTTDIMNLQYDGASMRPLVINSYALKLTISQIETMKTMIDEIKL
tara:strand:+ start:10 stop:528 length:519 start_codon:yes stop_codon:yes gene_type:complete